MNNSQNEFIKKNLCQTNCFLWKAVCAWSSMPFADVSEFFSEVSYGNLVQVYLLWGEEGANLRSYRWLPAPVWARFASEAPLAVPCVW